MNPGFQNALYRRFRETVEAAGGTPVRSPYTTLCSGKTDWSLIRRCLQETGNRVRCDKTWLDQLREWLKSSVDAEKIEILQQIPAEYFDGLRALGCLRARIPRRYGGLGLAQYDFAAALALIASHSEVLALVTSVQQLGVPQGLLSAQRLESGRSKQERWQGEVLREKYLQALAADSIGAFCLTTAETGSDPAKLQTVARQCESGRAYRLEGDWGHGGKLYTTLGTVADVYLMLAVVLYPGESVADVDPGRRITAFIVDRTLAGISVRPLDFCGFRGLPNAAIRLDRVRVPVGNRVGRVGEGLKIAFMNLATGRINLSAICLGMSRRLLAVARVWGKQRVQGGRRIGYHALNTRILTRMAASTYALDACVRYVSGLADRGDSDIRLEAAMLKLFASMTVIETADSTLQLRGGRGYETFASQQRRGECGAPVERLYRSARLMTIGEGGSNVLMLYIMRCLLDPVVRDYQAVSAGRGSRRASAVAVCRMGLRMLNAFLPRAGRYRSSPERKLNRHFAYLRSAERRFARRLHARMLAGAARGMTDVIRRPRKQEPDSLDLAESLEHDQVLLGHYAMIATWLWVMTVCCLQTEQAGDSRHQELADEFCDLARESVAVQYLRIDLWTSSARGKTTRRGHALLRGRFSAITEQDIVSLWPGSETGPEERNSD